MKLLTRTQRTIGVMTLGCVAMLAAPACSDDGDTASSDAKTSTKTDSKDGKTDADDAEPIYLYNIAIYSPQGTLQYSLLRNEIDLDISVDDLKSAHEFPGYTGVAAIGGYVVSGDSETPFATKWRIGDDFSWKQVGNKLNFTEYFTADADGLNFYFQSINGSDMYFFYGAERTGRIHWNVDEWKIVGDHQDTDLPSRSGWTLGNMGNRSGMRDYGGPVVWPFTLSNEENWLPSDESWLAVYDEDTHEERDVIEVPCPGLAQSTRDEQGNLYFGTTFNVPTLALYGKAPASCVVKINIDGALDESFGYNDLTELTGGFYGVNFRYIGDGKATANVLHHDRLEGVDFSGEVDPAVEVQISGQWTDDGYVTEDATLWELHLIDLEEGTSQIVEGFEPEHDVSYYTIIFQVDGHTFITVQQEVETGGTHNAVYELDSSTARVKSVGYTVGDLWGISRVR